MSRLELSDVPEGIRNAVSSLYLNIDNVSFRKRLIDGETCINVRVRERIDIEAKEMLLLLANGLQSIEPFVFNDTNGPVASMKLMFVL